MHSPYSRNKYRKRNNKSKSTITHTTSETAKTNKNIKIKKKKDLKGGSILENNQEDNTKFITLARKMINSN